MKNRYKFNLLKFEGHIFQFIAFDTYFIKKAIKDGTEGEFVKFCENIKLQQQPSWRILAVINPEETLDEVVKVRVLINYTFLWRKFSDILKLKAPKKKLGIHRIMRWIKPFNVLSESIIYFYELNDDNEGLGVVLREFYIDEDQISSTFLDIFCFSGKGLL